MKVFSRNKTYFQITVLFILSMVLFTNVQAQTMPSSIGWTAGSGNSPAGQLLCNQWSATWCAGSGTYSEVNLVKGVNYTVENLGSAVCGTALPNAYVQAWWSGGTTACSYGAIGSPDLNTISFDAPLTGLHRIAVSSNESSATANTCGAAKGHDFTGRSAVLRYRQNTMVNNTTSTTTICNGTTKALSAILSGPHDNPEVEWTVVSGGGTISGNTYTATTSNTVTVRATVGACFSDVSFIVEDAASAPTSISGDDYVCSGNPVTLIAIGGANTANSVFQWGTGSVVGQNVISGASSNTYTSGPLTSTTNFWVRKLNTAGPCTGVITSAAELMVIVSTPLSTEDISICADELPFQWNGLTVTSGGSSAATYLTTNAHGCDSTTVLNLVLKALPVVDLGPDTLFCSGQTYSLSAANPNCTYNWNTTETSSQITVNQSGNYSVVVTNSFGCTSQDDVQVTFNGSLPTSSGVQSTFQGGHSFKFSVINPVNVVSYEWNFGDGVGTSIQATPTYVYPNSGNYLAKVKLKSDCGQRYDSTYVHIVGIADLKNDNTNFKIYPNPSQGKVTIENKTNVQIKHVEIVNILGQKIKQYSLSQLQKNVLDLSEFPNGIYHLIIVTDQGRENLKLEKIN